MAIALQSFPSWEAQAQEIMFPSPGRSSLASAALAALSDLSDFAPLHRAQAARKSAISD
jgi:hypothetical protein